MNNIKSKLSLVAAFIIVACGMVSLFNNVCSLYVSNILPEWKPKKTIVIDPGHGGYDPGKVGITGILEKDINLSISLLLKTELEKNGCKVVMTRTDDNELCSPDCNNKKTDDLNHRIEIIEKTKPEFVISIHQNSFPDTSVSGAQVFYYGSEESVTNDSGSLAEYIQNALIHLQNPDNHRQAKANTSYYLLKNTTCPVVIVECGFLSNYSEESLLNDTAYQEKTASAICQGILDYINAN